MHLGSSTLCLPNMYKVLGSMLSNTAICWLTLLPPVWRAAWCALCTVRRLCSFLLSHTWLSPQCPLSTTPLFACRYTLLFKELSQSLHHYQPGSLLQTLFFTSSAIWREIGDCLRIELSVWKKQTGVKLIFVEWMNEWINKYTKITTRKWCC